MMKVRTISALLLVVILLLLFSMQAIPSVIAAPSGNIPGIGNCPLFPPDNPWNRNISNDPVHPMSDDWIDTMMSHGPKKLRPMFGHWDIYGFPYIVVGDSTPKMPIEYKEWGSQSDPGPFPIPPDAPVEGLGRVESDKHVIAVDKDNCLLYELYNAEWDGKAWKASSGAKFNLRTNDLRPEGWTSADAAGLPIFPGLIRYEEVATGEIRHALRMIAGKHMTGKKYLYPARHYQSQDDDLDLVPMGARIRLRKDFDISGYRGHARIILEALKKYGAFIADEGTAWMLPGTSSVLWDRDNIEMLRSVPGWAFEFVDPNYSPAQQTAAAFTRLSLQYRAGDYYHKNSNMHPEFQIVNKGHGYAPFSELTIRYYFAKDTENDLMIKCDYAHIGCKNVELKLVELPRPLIGATHYIEVGFTNNAGMIPPMLFSREIELRVYEQSWGKHDESNDYSYDGSKLEFADWDRVTMYRNGTLIWGREPSGLATPVPTKTLTPSPTPNMGVGQFNVQYRPGEADPEALSRVSSNGNKDNMIRPYFNILSMHPGTVRFSELTIRYYFTRDGNQPIDFTCDYAFVGCDDVIGKIVKMTQRAEKSDTYVELSFADDAGWLVPGNQSGDIQVHLNKADWSNFNQKNDYSYDGSKVRFAAWPRTVLYRNGVRVWGIEPKPDDDDNGNDDDDDGGNGNDPTRTPTPQPTNTPVPPTRTSSATKTATSTSTPVPPTATSTPVPPTDAPTDEPTNEIVPTNTPTGQVKFNVYYRPGENNVNDSTVAPFFNIANVGTAPIRYSDLKLRYYFTRDGNKPIIARCDFAYINCANITITVVAQNTPTATSDSYLELSFTDGAGWLGPNHISGDIQVHFYRADWSEFNEANDYSFDGRKTQFAAWPRAVLYHNGTLIWGVEPDADSDNGSGNDPATLAPPTLTPTVPATATPTAVPPTNTPSIGGTSVVFGVGQLMLQYQPGENKPKDNKITPFLNIANSSPNAIRYSELTARYYFTRDGDERIEFTCDYAYIGCQNIVAKVVVLPKPHDNADAYVELSFTDGAGWLGSNTTSGDIQFHLNKADWSNFNEANDYSFDMYKTRLSFWMRVVLYRQGFRVWGLEPQPVSGQ